MTRDPNSLFRRLRRDERGAVAVLVAAGLVALVGFGALVVDVGFYFYAQRVVQASAQAAALAGAQGLGFGGTPLTTANTYSAASGDKNAVAHLSVTVVSTSTFLSCATNWATSAGVPCSINQTPPCVSGNNTQCNGSTSGANLLTVTETATVPTFFGRIFGINSIPVTASATASSAGSALGPYNVAVILDTTASMGGTVVTGCSSGTAENCAIGGVQTLLGELWPCASGLASCSGATPVDQAALFTFPPVTNASQAALDYNCTKTNPQIATYYSGVEGIANGTTSATVGLLPQTASIKGSITGTTLTVTTAASGGLAMGSAITSGALAGTTVTLFGTGIGALGTYTVSKSQTVAAGTAMTISNSSIPWGWYNAKPPASSANMTATNAFNTTTTGNPGSPWAAVVKDNVNAVIPAGTGNWPWWGTGTTISSVSTSTAPGSVTLSASPTGTGVKGGDTIFAAPLYQITNFAADYRASDTASTLSSTSDIVKATNTGCLGTPGGLGTYYADAISAAQTALVAQQNANTTAGRPAGENVIILLSDGAASSSSGATGQMGPLLTAQATYECGAAVLASQAAAAAGHTVAGTGTKVYAVFYDDNGGGCNDTAKAPGLSSVMTSACTAMQLIANAPSSSSPYFVNDQPKLFYSTDGNSKSATCPSASSYTSISQIFQQIVASLTNARLVPVGTI
jgi:Flp pilus assembly protein TadG